MSRYHHRNFEVFPYTGEADNRAILFFHNTGEADFGLEVRNEIEGLLQDGFSIIEIDLRAIDTCNSITLGMFVGLQTIIKKANGHISFNIRAGTHVRRMFTTLKLDAVLEVREVNSVSPPPRAITPGESYVQSPPPERKRKSVKRSTLIREDQQRFFHDNAAAESNPPDLENDVA